jgi:CRP-like cAMP-binding protein
MHMMTKAEQGRVTGPADESTDGDNENVNAPSLSSPVALRQRTGAPRPTSTSIYAKRHAVFDEQHEADAIYQVISGAVILTRSTPAGHRQVLEVVGPGGVVGVVSGTHYGCRAETMTRTVMRRITRRTVERSAGLQRALGEALTRKLERLHDEARMRRRMSATECVAALILSLPRAEPETPVREGDADNRLALPQSDIASYLGLAMETVCRAMKSLKHTGAIRTLGRESIVILDAPALARLAGTEPLVLKSS